MWSNTYKLFATDLTNNAEMSALVKEIRFLTVMKYYMQQMPCLIMELAQVAGMRGENPFPGIPSLSRLRSALSQPRFVNSAIKHCLSSVLYFEMLQSSRTFCFSAHEAGGSR